MVIVLENIKLFILALIQGISEPLPISSSGHLILFEELLGIELPGLYFETLVNFGSFFAVLFFYRKKVIALLKNSFIYLKTKGEGKKEFNYILLIVVATIPSALIGFLIREKMSIFKNSLSVGIALIITGIFLLNINRKGNKEIRFKDGMIIGIAQVFALFPGISRSGSTIVAGLKRDLKIEEVLEFSFLMYLPISLLSGVYSLLKLNLVVNSAYFISFIISAVSTYFALKIFIEIIKKQKLSLFSFYCFSVGSTVLIINFINLRQ